MSTPPGRWFYFSPYLALEETGEPAELSKTNIHVHFVQFDTQSSDGVITGASYEQAPRPFIDPGMSLAIQRDSAAGADRVQLDDVSSFHVGSTVAVGIDQLAAASETAVIEEIDGSTLVFNRPLKNPHKAGELVSVEFVLHR